MDRKNFVFESVVKFMELSVVFELVEDFFLVILSDFLESFRNLSLNFNRVRKVFKLKLILLKSKIVKGIFILLFFEKNDLFGNKFDDLS